jgi:hypothetical protein
MSTSHITFRRRVRRGALALAVSAICLPSSALAQGDTKADYPGSSGYVGTHFPVAAQPAKAGDTELDYPRTGEPPTAAVTPPRGDTPADYPGMPGSPVVVSDPAPAPEATGFDWTSAAIGAAGAGLLVVVSLAGAAAASRIRMRTVRS